LIQARSLSKKVVIQENHTVKAKLDEEVTAYAVASKAGAASSDWKRRQQDTGRLE